jgi:hypothetical protein
MTPFMVAMLEAVRAGLTWPEILAAAGIPYRDVQAMRGESATFAARLDRAMLKAPEIRRELRRLEHLIIVHKVELAKTMTAPLRRRQAAREGLIAYAHGRTRPREESSI